MLLDMADKDQAIRKKLVGNVNPSDKSKKSMIDIDETHTAKLKTIFEKYGWPNISMIGYDGVQAFWLLAQHSTDDDFRHALMPHVKAAFDDGNLSPQSYALFVDQLLISDGKPQKYGTQIKEMVDKEPVLFPIENRRNVNALRASIGLFNLEDYLLLAKAATFPEEDIKPPFSDKSKHNTGIGIEFDIRGSGPIENMTLETLTVSRVTKGSTADQAGIVAGDKIIEIDGMVVAGSNINTLMPAMDKPAGDHVTLVIKRLDDSQKKITVEIAATTPE